MATNPVLFLYKAKATAGPFPHLETLSLAERKRKWVVGDLKIIIYSFTATSSSIKTKQLFPSCLEESGTIPSVVVDCFSIIQQHKRN